MPDIFVAKNSKDEDKKKEPSDPKAAPGVVTIQKREMHPLTTFHTFPEGITFENQERDEVIHLFLRRHFVTNVGWILTSLFFSLIPLIVIVIQASGIFLLPEIPFSYVLIVLIFYYLILFGYNLINFVSWFYNIGIITQLRVLDVDLSNIQHKNVSSTTLHDIVDVSYSQKGFLQNFFDYGDVVLQTEGITENFEFFKIPHPAKTTDIISDLTAGRSSE